LAEGKNFSRLAQEAGVWVRKRGFRVTDHFRGLYLKGRLTPPLFEEMLRELPPGLTELMVHPGRISIIPLSTPFSSFSIPAREAELETLLDEDLSGVLARHGIELTPFPEGGN